MKIFLLSKTSHPIKTQNMMIVDQLVANHNNKNFRNEVSDVISVYE